MNGKEDFFFNGTPTADDVKGICSNDGTPSDPTYKYLPDTACPGPALSFDDIVKLIPSGKDRREIGQYQITGSAREYKPGSSPSGFSPWKEITSKILVTDRENDGVFDIAKGFATLEVLYPGKVVMLFGDSLSEALAEGRLANDKLCNVNDDGTILCKDGDQLAVAFSNATFTTFPQSLNVKITKDCLYVGGITTVPTREGGQIAFAATVRF
ncbi:hypothetical protein AKJ09_03204 [Labilithrix luteola]|uniref:Uncharacterized protein n=1 Tax=Labilithrix luteola TaxID=1391654 RepID=A0A0K1PSM4_9BACT|nr:hypothetical protein AKJ09_03204 [Labilithrix luteola]